MFACFRDFGARRQLSTIVAGLIAASLLLHASIAAADHGVFKPESFTLANGMQVIVVPNHRAPVVNHMVWYRAGSADELSGKTGTAHLLEHLMFKGTKTLKAGEFSRIIARNGGRENAFTSYDFTGYFQTLAVDRLEQIMKLEADRMRNLIITEDEMNQERKVVLEERRQRTENRPSAILREHAKAALYMNHPYRRPIIGWEHELRALTIADLKAFYDKQYQPNNAALIVAGDITLEQLRPMAERTYGKIPAGPAVNRMRPKEPPHRASRTVTLKDKRVRQPAWSRSFLAPSYTEGDVKEAYALELLDEVLGSGSTSRLYRALVVNRKIAVSVGTRFDPVALGPGTFIVYSSPQPGISMEVMQTAVEGEIAKLLIEGITQDELERAKERMRASAIFARDSLRTGARVFGNAVSIGRTLEDVENWPHRVDAVTVDEVNAVARKVIVKSRSVTAFLLPEEAS